MDVLPLVGQREKRRVPAGCKASCPEVPRLGHSRGSNAAPTAVCRPEDGHGQQEAGEEAPHMRKVVNHRRQADESDDGRVNSL